MPARITLKLKGIYMKNQHQPAAPAQPMTMAQFRHSFDLAARESGLIAPQPPHRPAPAAPARPAAPLSAWATIEQRAAALQVAEPHLSRAQAITRAVEADPALYRQYLAEQYS
jgi:hypothetical protein